MDNLSFDSPQAHNTYSNTDPPKTVDNETKANHQRAKELLNIKTISSIINSRQRNRLEEVHVDHRIPKFLAGNVPELIKILNNHDNLQLVHVTCHAIKTKEEKASISLYRKMRQTYLANKLKTYTKEELQVRLATCKILIEMDKSRNELLEQYDSNTINKLIEVSKRIIKDHDHHHTTIL